MGAEGFANTVKGQVAVHPSAVLVYVSVTVPPEIPDTTPALVTVAMALLLEVHVPLVPGVIVAVTPTHTEVGPPATGLEGTGLMTILAVAGEVQLFELVTVKVNVELAGRPDTVKDVPEPVYVVPPGDRVMVHEPEAGSPLRITLPVGVVHVGWVMVPTNGADGFALTVNGSVLLQPSDVLV